MRVLVCGSRDHKDNRFIWLNLDLLHHKHKFTYLIQGGQRGADYFACQWANMNGVEEKEIKADWKRYGKAAGPMRNLALLNEGQPDLVIAFPLGKVDDPRANVGTRNMIKIAKNAGVKTIVIEEQEQCPNTASAFQPM